MLIKIYEFKVFAGDESAVMRGLDRQALLNSIADTCRKDWKLTGHVRGKPPADDMEVLTAYFKDGIDWADNKEDLDNEASDYVMIEEVTDLVLAPPSELVIQGEPGASMTISLRAGGGASSGKLIKDAGSGESREIVDHLEGFILRLGCAGFPIHLPEFQECVTETLEHMANTGVFDK